jgi:hypothetical protein
MHLASLLQALVFSDRVAWPGGISGDEWLAGKGPVEWLRKAAAAKPAAIAWLFAPYPNSKALKALEAVANGPGPNFLRGVFQHQLDLLRVTGVSHEVLQTSLVLALLDTGAVSAPWSELLAALRRSECSSCGQRYMNAIAYRLQRLYVDRPRWMEVEGVVIPTVNEFTKKLEQVRGKGVM